MLFLLRAKGGFRGRMLGVDYSGASVELARAVAGEEGVGGGGGGGGGDVEFRRWDALGAEELEGGWDVVLDKGTFDAVGLMGVEGVEARYVERVRGLVGRGGRVVVTSCNWTEGEVRAWFEGGGGEEEGELVFEGRVEYPRFRFGGLEGQSVCSVCFRKR